MHFAIGQTLEPLVVITPEENESEMDILRAIAAASYELAMPDLSTLGQQALKAQVAESEFLSCLRAATTSLEPRLDMTDLPGRVCHTKVYVGAEGRLMFDTYSFQQCRQDWQVPLILRRAQDLNWCARCEPGAPSLLFCGDALDQRLRFYKLMRGPEESDWEFRRRAFREIGLHWPHGGLEYLWGAHYRHWSGVEKRSSMMLTLHGIFGGGSEQDLRQALEEFLSVITDDPLPVRLRHELAALN